MKNSFLVTQFLVVVGMTVTLLLVPQNVYAQYCDSRCPGGNPCGSGQCTTWKFCCDGTPQPDDNYFCYTPGPCGCQPCTPPPPGGGGPGWGACGSCNTCMGGNPSQCRLDPGGACVWDPGGCGGPVCNSSVPAPAPLLSPADGARVPAATTGGFVYLDWGPTPGWGNGCPNNNTYQSRWGLKVGPYCDVGDLTNAGSIVPETTTLMVMPTSGPPAFAVGNTYCWTVRNSNGTFAVTQSPWEVTIIPNLSISSAGFAAPTRCGGARISGRAGYPDTNNPVTYNIDVTHPSNDFAAGINYIDEVRFGLISNAQANGVTSLQSILEPLLRNYLGFRVTGFNQTGAGAQYSAANAATNPVWGAQQPSGDLTTGAGLATLLGLGTQTRVTQVNNNTLRFTFVVRFENTFPSTTVLNSYVMAISEIDGVQYSQDYNGGSYLNYRRYDTWRTDLNPPVVSVTPPTPLPTPNNFQIIWNATESATNDSGIAVRNGTCTVTGGNIRIRQQTSPVTDIILDDGVPATCLFGTLNGARNYIYTLLAPYDSFETNYYVRDAACNESTASGVAASAPPWTMVARGPATAGGGFDFTIPNINLGSFLTGFGDEAFASAFSTISGNSITTPSRQSRYQTYTTGYNDLNTDPAQIIGLSNWYDTFYSILSERYPGQIVDSNVNTMGINLSSFPATTGTLLVRYTPPTGTLSTATGAATNFTCNRNAIILVNGNMTINPNFVQSGTNRCVWIVRGNLTVNRGSNLNLVGGATPNTLNYDQLAGAFIVDGTFTTVADPRQTTPVNKYADGLQNPQAVVVANNVSLQRNLQDVYNARQPAELFVFDPRYIFEFSDELAVTKFSIRPR